MVRFSNIWYQNAFPNKFHSCGILYPKESFRAHGVNMVYPNGCGILYPKSPSGLTALVLVYPNGCGILYPKESFRAHGVGIQRRPSGFMVLIWSILTAVGSYILGSLMMRVQLVNSSRHPVLTKKI